MNGPLNTERKVTVSSDTATALRKERNALRRERDLLLAVVTPLVDKAEASVLYWKAIRDREWLTRAEWPSKRPENDAHRAQFEAAVHENSRLIHEADERHAAAFRAYRATLGRVPRHRIKAAGGHQPAPLDQHPTTPQKGAPQ